MLAHWMITYSYIQVAFETRQLLNPRVYSSSREQLTRVTRFKRCMLGVSALVVLLIVGDSACLFLGYVLEDDVLISVADHVYTGLLATFMMLWACTLFKLYRDVKSSSTLLPAKRVFQMHGGLLVAYLAIIIAGNITYRIYLKATTDIRKNDLIGVSDILNDLSCAVEIAMFTLVVWLMCPFTEDQKRKCKDLQKFLFNGFLNIKDLEAAIMDQHPNLSEEQQIYIKRELEVLYVLLENA